MLFIGIDEAGYGPRLGPLCHGYAAFRIPDAPEHTGKDGLQPPDLWKLFKPSVRKARKRATVSKKAILVDDSKLLHNAIHGYRTLERSIRAFLDCARTPDVHVERSDSCVNLDDLLPSDDISELRQDHWFERDVSSAAHPPHCQKALRKKLASSSARVVALGARAMSARRFNTILAGGCNKAEANWSVFAAILRALAALAEPGETVFAAIDWQGGRQRYVAQLSQAFDAALVHCVCEKRYDARYRIDDGARSIHVSFFVSGDSRHLPIALASMAAKLTREKCMERINAFFTDRQPGLKPTAGYYGDARRYIRDTKELRARLQVRDDHFIRFK